MHSGLKYRILAITLVIGLEPTYLTTKSEKWLVMVKKAKQDQARQKIDPIINDTIFPDSQVEKSGRSNHHNINSVLVSYTVSFQIEVTRLSFNSTTHPNIQSNDTFEHLTMLTILPLFLQ